MLKRMIVFLLMLGWVGSSFALIVPIPTGERVIVGSAGQINTACARELYEVPVTLLCEIPGFIIGDSAIVSILHNGNALGSFTLLGPGVQKFKIMITHPVSVSKASYQPVILLSSPRTVSTALLCLTVESGTSLCSLTHS